jgi:WD40 repeat protein
MPDGSGVDIVRAMAFTADGRSLLLGCKSGAVELRTREGQLLFRRQPDSEIVRSVVVAPGGRRLLSASGNTIRLWNSDGDPVGSFRTGDSPINAMAMSPDGRSLLTGHDDSSGLLWTLEGVLLRRFDDPRPFPTSDGGAVQVVFDPSGDEIALGHGTGTVRRWSLSGRLISEIDTGLEVLKVLAITPQGDLVAAGWHGARRWEATSGRLRGSLREEGIVEVLRLLPDGKAAVLAGSDVDGYLEMRDLQGRSLLSFQAPSGWPEGPMAISPDGKVLVMAEWNWLSSWELPEGIR